MYPMYRLTGRKLRFVLVFLTLLLVAALGTFTPNEPLRAADHGDAPLTAHDLGADLNDLYLFRDPNDNSRIIMIMTVHGFIVPGEASNFGIFDQTIRYRFEFETNGGPKPDGDIDVSFSPRIAVGNVPQAQIATINLPNGKSFMA